MSRSRRRPPGQGFQHHGPGSPEFAQALARRGRGAVWIGFWLGLLGYLLLSMQQPLGWRIPVWICLAFIALPALIGLLIGRKWGPEPSSRMKFWAGMKGAAWAMALYAFANSVVALKGLATGEGNGTRFLVLLLATVVYALLAGGISGTISALTARRVRKGEPA